jgi:hypothetical protein
MGAKVQGNEHFVGWRPGVGFVGGHCAGEDGLFGE